jgi:predicted carbohydrate-binding protein with CBM5 and CBM33 domain
MTTQKPSAPSLSSAFVVGLSCVALIASEARAHGTVVSPQSRVHKVYESNPENPSFALAANAIGLDGKTAYYTWNEVSRNISAAVQAGLPPGFDYSPWMPDGQLASAGRTDPGSPDYSWTYAGLDQVSADWPTTPVTAGETILVDYYATAPHNPSVWDVWMTTPDWDPSVPLTWGKMEFLGRPDVDFDGSHYTFDLEIPADRGGHHVLWVAWQRDDPVGEVFISVSDLDIEPLDRFADLGDGLVGSNGLPELTGAGTLAAGDPVSVSLTQALELAPATLVLGLSALDAPFKGGVLVPHPDVLFDGLTTDGAGELVVNGTWPAGVPSGFVTYLQCWIVDGQGPKGLAASNGLSATAP